MYQLPFQHDQYFFKHFAKTSGVYTNYENTLFVGNFNAQIGETHLDTFYIVMSYQKSIKNQHVIRTQKIQVAQILLCPIDEKVFLITSTVFTEFSDFRKLVLSVLKTKFPKSKPKEISYRNFKIFSEENCNQKFRKNRGEQYFRCFK